MIDKVFRGELYLIGSFSPASPEGFLKSFYPQEKFHEIQVQLRHGHNFCCKIVNVSL